MGNSHTGKDPSLMWGLPYCSWQSLHRETGCDNVNAECGPTSGWFPKGCGPPPPAFHGIQKAWEEAQM